MRGQVSSFPFLQTPIPAVVSCRKSCIAVRGPLVSLPCVSRSGSFICSLFACLPIPLTTSFTFRHSPPHPEHLLGFPLLSAASLPITSIILYYQSLIPQAPTNLSKTPSSVHLQHLAALQLNPVQPAQHPYHISMRHHHRHVLTARSLQHTL